MNKICIKEQDSFMNSFPTVHHLLSQDTGLSSSKRPPYVSLLPRPTTLFPPPSAGAASGASPASYVWLQRADPPQSANHMRQ